MKYLITGSSGFIGFHLAKELLKNQNNRVYGLDSLNKYYSISLKKKRTNILKKVRKRKLIYHLSYHNPNMIF